MSGLIQTFNEAVANIWPSPQRTRLPERVVQSIGRNDDVSEVLVKLIQLIIFALWGIFYLAAPPPDPTTTSSVPLIISVYLVLTLALLFFSLLRTVPGPLIYFSIILDMALLTYLIWSFHLQYGQPASFSLKVVEVVNYFVLIGLRALRFEARYVIAAGVTAILCWLAMVLYTVTIDPSDTMITRDYVTYLTSNSVLVGAEISKVISMAMFTIVLAIAVRRAHSFLVTSIAESSAAHDLSRFMADSVAEQIRDADHEIVAGESMRRNAAILNIDIRGFTKLVADMDPDDAMAILSDYQTEIVPIVHKHKGVVDKFMGDGIMVTFGAAAPDPQYCANAMNCIDEILEARKRWKGPAARITVNLAAVAGPVVYGAVGYGDRLEFTVIGSHVNLAAKLEKQNKERGTIALCGRILYENALKQGYRNPSAKPTELEVALGNTQSTFKAMVLA